MPGRSQHSAMESLLNAIACVTLAWPLIFQALHRQLTGVARAPHPIVSLAHHALTLPDDLILSVRPVRFFLNRLKLSHWSH